MSTHTSDRYTSTQEHDRRAIGNLLRDLGDDAARMVRQEVALAKAELSEKTARAGRNVAYLAAGGMVLFAGLLFLLLAANYLIAAGLAEAGISPEVNAWLAPLIVGIIVCMVGYALVQKAISTLKHESPVPHRTMDSVQETQAWLTHKVR